MVATEMKTEGNDLFVTKSDFEKSYYYIIEILFLAFPLEQSVKQK